VDIIPANLRFAVTEEGMNWEQEASREEVTDKKPISTDVTTEGTADKKSTSTESETSTEAKQEIEELPVTGTKETVSGVVYKVTKSSAETKEVTYVESTDKKKTTVKIPDTVTIDGQSYKVTAIANKALKNNKKIKTVTIGKNVTKIGKEAFSGCKNLKKIIIKSSTLKSVDKNAIKNINENATIKVPKKQLSKYKKLFKSKTGYKKSMKIKK
jgi:sorbitol-specific phosphotransferase system component IIA